MKTHVPLMSVEFAVLVWLPVDSSLWESSDFFKQRS